MAPKPSPFLKESSGDKTDLLPPRPGSSGDLLSPDGKHKRSRTPSATEIFSIRAEPR